MEALPSFILSMIVRLVIIMSVIINSIMFGSLIGMQLDGTLGGIWLLGGGFIAGTLQWKFWKRSRYVLGFRGSHSRLSTKETEGRRPATVRMKLTAAMSMALMLGYTVVIVAALYIAKTNILAELFVATLLSALTLALLAVLHFHEPRKDSP